MLKDRISIIKKNNNPNNIVASKYCDHQKLKKLLNDGKSVSEIAKELGVSIQCVYKVIRSNNWKGLIKNKRNKILNLILSGSSDIEISKRLKVSRSTIYRTKKKIKRLPKRKVNKKKSLTEWSEKTFKDIKEISKKYQKKLLLRNIVIDICEIESVLLDLMIHTDQKDIENKDAYFRKYCPLKISNLVKKILSNKTESIIDHETGEETIPYGIDPEKLLILYEHYTKKIK